MNRRDTQMLAHEMALYQRARAPGGNNSPTFQHPPGVQVPHSSNILTPRPAWTGGPLMGHVPQAMGVQQHPSHGHANGPGGLPRQPQPQYLQQQQQQQQWTMNVPPQGPPHSTQAHMQQPQSWSHAQQPQPQQRGQPVQHQIGYTNRPRPPQLPPQQHGGYNNSPLPPPPYHHQQPQQQHNRLQVQQQKYQQQWQSGRPPPNSLNGPPLGSSGSMLRPPPQNGIANAGGWVQNQPQQNSNNNNNNNSGNKGGYRSPIEPHQKRATSAGGRAVQKAMDSTTNDSNNTSNNADRHLGESSSPEAKGAATSDANLTAAVASSSSSGEGTASVVTTVSLFCEPCEKDFASVNAHQAHLLSHVPCSEAGCNFSASRKVVGAHHSATHGRFSGSGFQTISVEGRKFRVLLGTSPEEVEEWRAARRKRWPTSANVARKEEEEKMRRALGGLGPDPGPMARGGRGGRGRGGGRGGGGRGRGTHCVQSGRDSSAAVPTPKVVVEMDDGVAGPGRGVKRGGEEAGLSAEETPSKTTRTAVVDDTGPSAAETAEVSVDTVPEQPVAEVAGQGGVGGEENAGEGGVATEDDANVATGARKRPCTYYLRGRCTRGEGCTFSHDLQRQNCSYFMSGSCHRGKGCTYMHDKEARAKANLAGAEGGAGAGTETKGKVTHTARNAKPQASKPTLLRKLLAPQLHRESSIALQAVRFIASSNFFLAPQLQNPLCPPN